MYGAFSARPVPLPMPQVSIVCPHCEAKVTLQVTEVARSRTCPECGQSLVFQVAERESGVKRRALLVGDSLPEPRPPTGPLQHQRQFTGQPLDRMRADPELQRARKRLKVGILSVAALIFFTIVWRLVPMEAPVQVKTDSRPAAQETVLLPASRTEVPGRSHLAPMLSRPLDFEQIVNARKKELQSSRQGGE